MATTSPDNIWSPDSGDDYALTVDLAAMADTVQDALTAVKTYRIMTDAQRLALTGADLFEGLTVYTTDNDTEWRYTGSSWIRIGGDTGWTSFTSFGTGWTATAGYTPQIRRIGNRVQIRGALTLGSNGAYSSIATLPEGFRPSANTWLGVSQSSQLGVSGMLLLNSSGLLTVPSLYRTGSPTTGAVFPLVGTWFTD